MFLRFGVGGWRWGLGVCGGRLVGRRVGVAAAAICKTVISGLKGWAGAVGEAGAGLGTRVVVG